MKYFLLIFLSCSTLVFSQKMKQTKIVDSETGIAIPNARIIDDNQIYYSNDDGFISIPKEAKQLEVSVAGYEPLKSAKQQSVIKLKPLYNDIDEIKIVSIDVKKLFTDVYKNYDKRYYNQSAMYDVTYSQKRFENNKMKLLAVADGKFWTRDGQYNAKEAFNKKHDNFVQLQIDTVRYLKTEPNSFYISLKKPKAAHENVGTLFFNYTLFYIMRLSKSKNVLTSGKLLFENEKIQEIFYKIKNVQNEIYSGTIIFDKKDRAIMYFEMNFDQSNYKPDHLKDADGNDFQYQPPNGKYVYDFYKSGDKYVPSKISIKYEGIKYIIGDQVIEYRTTKDVVFKNFQKTTQTGLKNPVEINGYFWKDRKITPNKGVVDLSKEEQNFINDKANENQ